MLVDVPPYVFADAVREFWKTRDRQARQQETAGTKDQGERSSVTGGKQMDAFADVIVKFLVETGVPKDCICTRNCRPELPGFFRPTKQWDLLVVVEKCLLVSMELKSQVGPSFGNNFNNRTEEAIGTAIDVWTAYRDGALGTSIRPWIGYLFVLEDCAKSRAPVAVNEPHFKVFEEFRGASYAKRYELLCRKLVLEKHYDAACLVLTDRTRADNRHNYVEPVEDLAAQHFVTKMVANVAASLHQLGIVR